MTIASQRVVRSEPENTMKRRAVRIKVYFMRIAKRRIAKSTINFTPRMNIRVITSVYEGYSRMGGIIWELCRDIFNSI